MSTHDPKDGLKKEKCVKCRLIELLRQRCTCATMDSVFPNYRCPACRDVAEIQTNEKCKCDAVLNHPRPAAG